MVLNKQYKRLRLVLGDQLNASHSWFKQKDKDTLYIIAELHQETLYVKHHCQKICAFFAAMQSFAKALEKAGHHILYLDLDDTVGYKSLPQLLKHLATNYKISEFEYQQPDEYRLLTQLAELKLDKQITIRMCDSEHFLLPFSEIKDYFKKDKHHKMEFFYRKMRQRFTILMDEDQPLGGQWNYDAQNRNKLKQNHIEDIPSPLTFNHDVSPIMDRLRRHKVPFFGSETNTLIWPVNRKQALKLLDYFCTCCLPKFGTFQDAMTCQSKHQWSLYHSRLSFVINAKILHPMQVLEKAVDHYYRHQQTISIAQIEGFVRQILGWREYIRGVYWANMPAYAGKNHLNAKRALPKYFWTGNTKMRCMQSAIQQSLDYSYAHHIQRLMVTGNFCLLTGIDPKAVDDWYLGVYIDAIEWVEMPNTRGMSQFADGGIVATKPYTAGGNYIHKMSDYCQHCHYKVKEKVNDNACPFNSLYWHFMIQHRKQFEKNPRIGMVYRNWDKQAQEQQQATIQRARWCLKNIEKL
ncbi:MAG: cryptochrome/photolyase family protein [Pseudomonadota bacterium]